MINLQVWIEIKGERVPAGFLRGNHFGDTCFFYSKEYMNLDSAGPLSVSLPFQDEPFSAEQTRNFFDGLLPEGFTRRCVAEEIQVDPSDYIAILKCLGEECLGAIQITTLNNEATEYDYRKASTDEMIAFAKEGAMKSADLVTKSHLSLTGASGKTGMYLAESGVWYLPVGSAPSTHILKQSHVRLEKIITNELLCMRTASKLGIAVPENRMISFNGTDAILYSTKRYDRKMENSNRKVNGLPVPFRLHQEDFAQAMGISSLQKYEKNGDDYFGKMFRKLREVSANPLEDQLKLWDMLLFDFFIGNTDAHIKNFSLLYNEELRGIRLAPAYDLVSTLFYSRSTDQMAISVNGEHNIHKITREHFQKAASNVGIGQRLAMGQYDAMKKAFASAVEEANEELAKENIIGDEIKQYILSRFKNIQ